MMRKILLASTALVLCTGAGNVAWGQAAAPANGVEKLETVVVTAEKRPERLQDAPVAVSVLSSDTLAAADASDISDLNKLVPSVQLNGTINGRVPLAVRGISSDSNEQTVGISSGVAVAIDGVPVPSDSYAGNQLEDVTNIEVLKGPQSTLGGRTASAGEINIITHSPSDVWTGSASATVTGDNEEHVQAFVAGPLANELSFSLAGWGHNLQYPIQNLFNNKYTSSESYGGRFKLLFQPTENLDITLAGRYSEFQSKGMNFVYTYLTPGDCLFVGPGFPPCSPGFPTSAANLFPNVTPSMTNLKYNSPVPNVGATAHDVDVSLTLDYRLGGGYTLSSTTSYQRENQFNRQDLFTTAVLGFNALTGCGCFNDTQTQREIIQQKSEEIKLLSPEDRAFSYVVGLFYSDTTVNLVEFRGLPPAALDLTVVPDTATYDVYGRVTWKVLENTKVIAGLRFNYDDLSYKYTQTTYATAGGPPLFTPPISCAYCYSNGSNTSSALIGDVTLQQQISPDSMAYFKYSRGYAPKAYNTSAWLTCANIYDVTCAGTGTYRQAATLTPVAQESINSFEVGSKGTYFDNKLSLNVDAFYTDYKNFQVQVQSVVPGLINPPLILTTAGEADTKGVEVEALLAPTDNTTLGFNAAYIDARFVKYTGAPGIVGVSTTQDVSGKPMPNSPKFKFTLSATQTIPLENMPFNLTIGGNYTYRTSAQMLADQNPQAVQPAFGLLNLNLGFVSKDGKYSLTAFVNNVADQRYYVDMEDFWASPWGANTVIGQPGRDATRFFGVRLEHSF